MAYNFNLFQQDLEPKTINERSQERGIVNEVPVQQLAGQIIPEGQGSGTMAKIGGKILSTIISSFFNMGTRGVTGPLSLNEGRKPGEEELKIDNETTDYRQFYPYSVGTVVERSQPLSVTDKMNFQNFGFKPPNNYQALKALEYAEGGPRVMPYMNVMEEAAIKNSLMNAALSAANTERGIDKSIAASSLLPGSGVRADGYVYPQAYWDDYDGQNWYAEDLRSGSQGRQIPRYNEGKTGGPLSNRQMKQEKHNQDMRHREEKHRANLA